MKAERNKSTDKRSLTNVHNLHLIKLQKQNVILMFEHKFDVNEVLLITPY